MKHPSDTNTERLFDALGEVDDRLLEEALLPIKAKKPLPTHRIALLAASLILAVTVAVIFPLLLRQGAMGSDDASGNPNNALTGADDDQQNQGTAAPEHGGISGGIENGTGPLFGMQGSLPTEKDSDLDNKQDPGNGDSFGDPVDTAADTTPDPGVTDPDPLPVE